MHELFKVFFEQGILGILVGVGFYLFFLERKDSAQLRTEKEETSKTPGRI